VRKKKEKRIDVVVPLLFSVQSSRYLMKNASISSTAEFDKVIFDPETELGKVVGPVQTQFGYHLIVVDKRTGV
jgi:hypothetical protein